MEAALVAKGRMERGNHLEVGWPIRGYNHNRLQIINAKPRAGHRNNEGRDVRDITRAASPGSTGCMTQGRRGRVLKSNTKTLSLADWPSKHHTGKTGKSEASTGLKLWQAIQQEGLTSARGVGGSPRREVRARNEEPTSHMGGTANNRNVVEIKN